MRTIHLVARLHDNGEVDTYAKCVACKKVKLFEDEFLLSDMCRSLIPMPRSTRAVFDPWNVTCTACRQRAMA